VLGANRKINSNTIKFIDKNFEVKKIILTEEPSLSIEYEKLCQDLEVEEFTHHTSHAMSAFYMSPFDEAVCLVIDAIGSAYTLPTEQHIKKVDGQGISGVRGNETTSIIEISKNYKTKLLYKRSQILPVLLYNKPEGVVPIAFIGAGLYQHKVREKCDPFKKVFNFISDASSHMDIGNMYHTISLHLGFGWHGHGKVMGLAGYGKEDLSIPPFLVNDTIYSNNNLFSLGRELNESLYPELFENLTFDKKANISYAMQRSLEKTFLHHAEFIMKNSKSRNLVIGGGCALNILGVSLIKQHYPEFNIFVDPIAHDATHSIGQGIHYYNVLIKKCQLEKRNNFNSIYLGPKYDEAQMNSEIDAYVNAQRV